MKCLSSRHSDNAGNRDAMPCCWGHASPLLLEIEGTRVRYVGQGADDSDAAAVRSNRPCPRSVGIYYFEVDIISRGNNNNNNINNNNEINDNNNVKINNTDINHGNNR